MWWLAPRQLLCLVLSVCLRAACRTQCPCLPEDLFLNVRLICPSAPLHPSLRPCWLSLVHPTGGLNSFLPYFPAGPPWKSVFRVTQYRPSGYCNICSSTSDSQGRDSVIFILGCSKWHLVSSSDCVTTFYEQTHLYKEMCPFYHHGRSDHKDRNSYVQGGNIPPSSCQQRGSGEIRQSLPRWLGWNFLLEESDTVLPLTGARASQLLWGTWTIQG